MQLHKELMQRARLAEKQTQTNLLVFSHICTLSWLAASHRSTNASRAEAVRNHGQDHSSPIVGCAMELVTREWAYMGEVSTWGLSGVFVLWGCQQIKECGQHNTGAGGVKIEHSMETAFLMDLKCSARVFLLPLRAGEQDHNHTTRYPWLTASELHLERALRGEA